MSETLSDKRTLAGDGDASLYYHFPAGTRIGPHTVRRLIGVGGMGEVYEVDHDLSVGPRALKVVARKLADDDVAIQAFSNEVRLMRTLRHPNVVSIEDAGVDGPCHWLRMELMQSVRYGDVDVRSLDDYLRAVQAESGAVAQGTLFAILENVTDAVAEAHARRLVHRDLKPANVLMTHCGDRSEDEAVMEIRVADFGMAKVAGEAWVLQQSRHSMARPRTIGDCPTRVELSQFERDGALIGTYDFMSPEQKAGRPAGPPSDVYSLGLMTFRALVGTSLSPDPLQVLRRDLVPAWDGVLRRALEHEPARRYPDAAAFRAALSEVERQLRRAGIIEADMG